MRASTSAAWSPGRLHFAFEGNSQLLDHFLVSERLLHKVEYDIVRINSKLKFDSARRRFLGSISVVNAAGTQRGDPYLAFPGSLVFSGLFE